MSDVPLVDLSAEVELLADELKDAVDGVLRSGMFINGPNVRAFEEEVAAFAGARYAIGVNSGTDALVIGLRALGIGPGDEVITTPFTFFATAEAISNVGATPVFVDIDIDTFNIDPQGVAAVVTPKTRALLPVHLFGLPADMGALMRIAQQYDLAVIEDVAQAFGGRSEGAMLGTIGDLGALSFFPSKNLGAYGDGGMILTDDGEAAGKARMLRAHGGRNKYANEMIGYNSRLDEIQAAMLRTKLRRLDGANALRRAVANRYDRALGNLPNLVLPSPSESHVYHQYTVRILSDFRAVVQDGLATAGIASAVYYPTPLHQLPVYSRMGGAFPNSETAAREVLSLPIWPTMAAPVIERVASAVQRLLQPA